MLYVSHYRSLLDDGKTKILLCLHISRYSRIAVVLHLLSLSFLLVTLEASRFSDNRICRCLKVLPM